MEAGTCRLNQEWLCICSPYCWTFHSCTIACSDRFMFLAFGWTSNRRECTCSLVEIYRDGSSHVSGTFDWALLFNIDVVLCSFFRYELIPLVLTFEILEPLEAFNTFTSATEAAISICRSTALSFSWAFPLALPKHVCCSKASGEPQVLPHLPHPWYTPMGWMKGWTYSLLIFMNTHSGRWKHYHKVEYHLEHLEQRIPSYTYIYRILPWKPSCSGQWLCSSAGALSQNCLYAEPVICSSSRPISTQGACDGGKVVSVTNCNALWLVWLFLSASHFLTSSKNIPFTTHTLLNHLFFRSCSSAGSITIKV